MLDTLRTLIALHTHRAHSMSAPAQCITNLLAASPPITTTHERQWYNVLRFVSSHHAAFSQLRYTPHIAMPTGARNLQKPATIAPSKLVPDLKGVYLQRDLKATTRYGSD